MVCKQTTVGQWVVQFFYLGFVILNPLNLVGEHTRQAINRLPLPAGDLRWVKAVLRCNLLHGFVTAQRFQRHGCFELIGKSASRRHLHIHSQELDTP